MKHIAILTAAILVFGCKEAETTVAVAPDDGTGLSATFDFDNLAIINDAGERLEFDIYLAITPDQQRQGLMFIRDLPERTGMLFVYDRPAIRSMWMKNTYIPLDLVFVDGKGSVSSIIHNATPLTLASRSSTAPVKYVLELNGGSAIKFKIGSDSRLVWSGDDAFSE